MAVAQIACLAAAVLAAAVSPAAAWGTGSWVNARATFFGEDAWSIHQGSCRFGFICPNRCALQASWFQDIVVRLCWRQSNVTAWV